ncbi:hypothetical protein [Kitasatospora sp. NPDC051914]|uniref:hypothetical protein n=1 Tax=Kitasatospora sp. NPDC051914 TaxID=3154945 RepID=UPI0034210C52
MAGPVLDWRDARHYDRTPLRDHTRRPAHKVCAERAMNDSGGPLPARTGAAANPAPF